MKVISTNLFTSICKQSMYIRDAKVGKSVLFLLALFNSQTYKNIPMTKLVLYQDSPYLFAARPRIHNCDCFRQF